jgi:hypothetical protein
VPLDIFKAVQGCTAKPDRAVRFMRFSYFSIGSGGGKREEDLSSEVPSWPLAENPMTSLFTWADSVQSVYF